MSLKSQGVTKYYNQFVREGDGDFVPQKCLGRIKDLKQGSVIYKKRLFIADETLEEILKEGRFPDKKVVLNENPNPPAMLGRIE